MGFVTPLLLRTGVQLGLPGPPPTLTSQRYTRDVTGVARQIHLAEVKALGSVDSTARTRAAASGSTAPPEACCMQLSDRRLPPRGLRLRRLTAVDKGTQGRGDCARCRARKWADDPSSKAWSGQRAVGDTYAVVAVRGRTRGHGSRSSHYCDRGDNAQEECSHTCLRSWLLLRCETRAAPGQSVGGD
jgi:hypothetical protein